MRGDHLHNDVLVERVAQALRAQGAITKKEYFIRFSGGSGYIDLLVEQGLVRIAVEAELTNRRIEKDLVKAIAVNAEELWIVTPTSHLARSIRSRLEKSPALVRTHPQVFVLSLGQALQRVGDCFSKNTASNGPKRKA